MKKALIGGFLSLIGSIWALSLISLASNNLTSGWSTPPGRFLTTLAELNLTAWFVLAIAFVLLGLVVLAIEYFKKEK